MSSSGQNDGGLMSSAGLVRYFESSSKNAIQLDPRSILAISILLSLGLMVVHAMV